MASQLTYFNPGESACDVLVPLDRKCPTPPQPRTRMLVRCQYRG